MTKKIQVTFSDGQWRLLNKFKGTIGESDSEIVRNIVISYLSEKSYIKAEVTMNSMQKNRANTNANYSEELPR